MKKIIIGVNQPVAKSARKIPATMATQHPDNATKPYFLKTRKVLTAHEGEECYRTYADLGCDEYMWDWEGKFVDEAVVDRFFNNYYPYFKKKQLGKDKFLTFRIPNIWKERGYRLARAFMAIITANDAARDLKMHAPPVFEVILPMTDTAEKLIHIQETYSKVVAYDKKIYKTTGNGPLMVNIIPLIEGTKALILSKKILENYVKKFKKKFKSDIDYLRPFIAHSDPALDAGFIPAVLAARGSISEYYRFEKETGIKVYPIIGVGSLKFRGGLNPESIDDFMKQYAGIKTVTIQSSFRYDYPKPTVIKAIKKLNTKLQKTKPMLLNNKEMKNLYTLEGIFKKHYRLVIKNIAKEINSISDQVPSHRERILHTGLFGYARGIEGTKVTLPRAIKFTASLYSLGVPPELIGTGRGLAEAEEKGLLPLLLKLYPTIKKNLLAVGYYLNKENLSFLQKKNKAFAQIATDIVLIESFCKTNLGPKNHNHYLHRNHTSNIYHLWHAKKPLKQDILKAAEIRKSLG